MKLLKFLGPAPYAPEIEDREEVDKRYKYWRFRVFYGMYIGYIFYYFTRKSFTFAMPALMQELGLQISDLGILSSILAITYGLSKFLSGILADRSNPRYFMGVGLLLTGVWNIFFGMSSSVIAFAIFWGLNGWFQGWGWPPCARLLTHWYSQKERGTWWGFWNTSHSVGGALIPIIAAFCAQAWGWRFAMYLPGITCIGIGLFLMNRLRDTPQSLGLPPIEKYKNDYAAKRVDEETELSVKEILFQHVLRNKYIWVLAISYFFVYIIRQAVNDFGALFLMQAKGYSIMAASASVFWFEAGGICGSLAAGWASDKVFQGRRGPINVLFSLGVIFAVAALYLAPAGMTFLTYGLMFAVGFLIFGPQMLIGMAAVELSHKKSAATASGFTGWVAYLGAAAAGYPITKIAENWGWYGFFLSLGVCGAITVLLLLPLWKIKSNPKYTAEAETTTA
ncbi:MAG: MFS transporter family glucose-6-phosphate receptor UhpC [Verrucomicrobia bacterium]|nr:MFS transporter family glucose-6-phosphate receptor UhpC [Verrucomicrobiota bacterium]